MELINQLSQTELKVAELVARGFSEKEIANKMFISHKTVHNHTYSIRRKWKAKSAVDVARKFILSLDDPKKFFIAFFFILLQIQISLYDEDIDMRRNGKRISQKSQFKTARKIS